MHYVETFDRNQMMMTTWDSMVDPESTARLIDAFVNSLDLADYGIKEMASEGRPPYDPRGLYKLYIYGSDNGIKSSRKLAKSCKVNIEVKWMLGGAEPDFRTISDFRKDNIDSIRKIFHEFNKRISGAVEWGFASIDGSKFAACNSKNNNFTKNKLDDRIKWLNGHIEEYLRILDEADKQEGFEETPDRNKCHRGKNEWKEIDFTKDSLEKPCRDWLKAEGKEADKRRGTKGKYHFEMKQIVRFFLKPDRNKTAERMCLSEHPFGTIKRAMGFDYFLLKGLRKVTGEFALMCLGYNIKRSKNLLGFEKMMELMAAECH